MHFDLPFGCYLISLMRSFYAKAPRVYLELDLMVKGSKTSIESPVLKPRGEANPTFNQN